MGWRLWVLPLLAVAAIGAPWVALANAQTGENASVAQYGCSNCPPRKPPPDLPLTGYLLVPVVGGGLLLLTVGLVMRRRTRR